jgi:hypothetical protein
MILPIVDKSKIERYPNPTKTDKIIGWVSIVIILIMGCIPLIHCLFF